MRRPGLHSLVSDPRSRDDDAELYADLIRVAAAVCRRIVADPPGEEDAPAAQRVWRVASDFLARCGAPSDPSAALRTDGRAPIRALWKLADDWPDLRAGRLTGETAFAGEPGLWNRLMTEPPMGRFATSTASFVNRAVSAGDTLVELGAGVGVTSALLRLPPDVVYHRTDLNPFLLRRPDLPGIPGRYDFDEPCPVRDANMIFSVNALHCARVPTRTLSYLREALRDGGRLVFAEGSPASDPNGLPSVMDMVFSQFSGWWDRSGFRSREHWLADLATAGFRDVGHDRIVAGRHVLGGLFWASR